MLEDECGLAHCLPFEAFGKLLSMGGLDRKTLLFLNGCNSEPLARICIAAGATHVIATKGPVLDQAARAFTSAFYIAAADGRTVGQSFEIAREALCSLPDPLGKIRESAEQFLLLPEESVHDVTIDDFLGPSSVPLSLNGSTSRDSFVVRTSLLPPVVEDFEPRGPLLFDLVRKIKDRRCVVVHGPAWRGVSTCLVEVCRYVSLPGRAYPCRTVYINLKCNSSPGIENVKYIEDAMQKELDPDDPLGDYNESDTDAPSGRSRCLVVIDHADAAIYEPTVRKWVDETLKSKYCNVHIVFGTHEPVYDASSWTKVANFPIPALDLRTASRLFARHVHRALMVKDFFPNHSSGDSIVQGCENAIHGLSNHPDLQGLLSTGNAGKICRAAEKVTPELASLFDLVNISKDEDLSSPTA